MSMKNFLYAREKLGISKQIGSITDWKKDPLSYFSSLALI